MPGVEVFNQYPDDYEKWFERNEAVFLSELGLIKSFIPDGLNGIEIGSGSGRFALPLGIKMGIEPSKEMAKLSLKKGLKVIRAYAENLPLPDNAFDFAALITTICFLDDPARALKEAFRVIKPGGFILIGFVPLESKIGRFYFENKDKSRFYKQAKFYRVREVMGLLKSAGFTGLESKQTLFEFKNKIQPFKRGHDTGGFVVLKSYKK